MSFWERQLSGPSDPAADSGWGEKSQPRKGFFTDTSICIGCKACEVACKEWNQLPEDGLNLLGSSYDNTGSLGATTWRHVAFIEQSAERIEQARASGAALVDLGMPTVGPPKGVEGGDGADGVDGGGTLGPNAPAIPDFRWLMSSDVCKHCTHAGCLDVCPTGALFRSEFGTVVVQSDICNGCGYCVPACPFGVIERRGPLNDQTSAEKVGVAQKCTLCYDRLGAGQTPSCAKACPTTSIKFGDLDEMRALAQERVDTLHAQGMTEARVYGGDEHDGVGGTGSVFLLLDEPEVYGLPPNPEVSTAKLPQMFRSAAFAAGGMMLAVATAFLGRRK